MNRVYQVVVLIESKNISDIGKCLIKHGERLIKSAEIYKEIDLTQDVGHIISGCGSGDTPDDWQLFSQDSFSKPVSLGTFVKEVTEKAD